MNIRIATRRSRLALWQANFVGSLLQQARPELNVTLVPLSTRGDEILDTSLAKIGGKGLFIKELERAMMAGEADIAVHSMKDVPAELPDGLCIGSIIERHDPRDALVGATLADLPEGAVVGTSSLRRAAQISHHRRDLKMEAIRGNVDTRLEKLHAGMFDAIVLAVSGLQRLELEDRIDDLLDPLVCLPAIGQGAIGVECRSNDDGVLELISQIEHAETRLAVDTERAMNRALGGSCVSPIAGHAIVDEQEVTLRGVVARVDGSELISVLANGNDPVTVGEEAAALLESNGAGEILDQTDV